MGTLVINNFFDCQETPLKFPDSSDAFKTFLNECPVNTAATVQLTAEVSGPCPLTVAADGFVIDENLLISLRYNGLDHTLHDSHLIFPGRHSTQPGEIPVAELQFYFVGRYRQGQEVTYCLAVPVYVGVGSTNEYFSKLNVITRARPTIASLFDESSAFLQYMGADMRGRTSRNSNPSGLCGMQMNRVNYLVATRGAQMLQTDFNRFQKMLGVAAAPTAARGPTVARGPTAAGGPSGSTTNTVCGRTTPQTFVGSADSIKRLTDFRGLVSVIPNIRVIGPRSNTKPGNVTTTSVSNYDFNYDTSRVKRINDTSYRLKSDIKDGLIRSAKEYTYVDVRATFRFRQGVVNDGQTLYGGLTLESNNAPTISMIRVNNRIHLTAPNYYEYLDIPPQNSTSTENYGIRTKNQDIIFIHNGVEILKKPKYELDDYTVAINLYGDTLVSEIAIDTLNSQGNIVKPQRAPNNTMNTEALKCRRLDANRDVKGNRVYVGGTSRPGDSSLKAELEESDVENTLDMEEPTVQPRDVERTMGIVFGVIAGLVGVSIISYIAWKFFFSRFKKNQAIYTNTLTAQGSRIAESIVGKSKQ